jgi:hypothetical protein
MIACFTLLCTGASFVAIKRVPMFMLVMRPLRNTERVLKNAGVDRLLHRQC